MIVDAVMIGQDISILFYSDLVRLWSCHAETFFCKERYGVPRRTVGGPAGRHGLAASQPGVCDRCDPEQARSHGTCVIKHAVSSAIRILYLSVDSR